MNLRYLAADGREASLGAPIAGFLARLAARQDAKELLGWLARPTRVVPAAIAAALGTARLEEIEEFLALLEHESGDLPGALNALTKRLDALPADGVAWA